MDHGGVLLKPPVALLTFDLHHHDSKFVMPVEQEFSLMKDGVDVLTEKKYNSSRKGSKKVYKFREQSSTNSTDSGCNPEMKGTFWLKCYEISETP